jgi:predicted transposase/invertase (TIGR01784 family)
MLLAEWNWDKFMAVREREAVERGIKQGIERGIEKGWQKGRQEIARSALAEGASVEFVRKITGLDAETIQSLRMGR